MFFPDNVLVSRTPGIATVWLMATLGARQNSKRVNKQAILKVDIPQACEAVHDPAAPMALRLQSNLLYGISRVYSQKCVYILTDAESAQTALKGLFKTLRTSELDPRAGKARPESLIVPDDPLFMPDLEFPIIDFDSSAFDSSGVSLLTDSNASGLSHASSRSNQSSYNFNLPQLEIPSGSFSGDLDRSTPALPLNTSRKLSVLENNDSHVLEDLGFEFDVTGNIIDYDATDESALQDLPVTAGDQHLGDVSFPPIDTDLMEGQPMDHIGRLTDDAFLPKDDQGITIQQSTEEDTVNMDTRSTDASNFSEYIEASQVRRKRVASAIELQPDSQVQILNHVLRQWDEHYVETMTAASKLKEAKQAYRQAKANAGFMMYQFGQYSTLGSDAVANSLGTFTSHLVQQLTGMQREARAANKSRRRGSTSTQSSSNHESERQNARLDGEIEEPRGQVNAEEEFIVLPDEDPSIELAREAVALMDDYSTQFPLPWSGSRQGSIHSARVSRSRQASILSARAVGNAGAIRATSVHSFDRRASRLASASPLVGRGSTRQSINVQGHDSGSGIDDIGLASGFDSGPNTSPQRPGINTEEFELFGPAAGVSTQIAGESQWLREALNRESGEFYTWIENSIKTKREEQSQQTDEFAISINFDQLLPPQQHSRAVAAQGFLHVLALASTNMITVNQQIRDQDGHEFWWGGLELSLNEFR